MDRRVSAGHNMIWSGIPHGESWHCAVPIPRAQTLPMTVLEHDNQRIRREAVHLSGRTEDLVQRAAVYYHLFEHSQGNHVFPLLAAHGALWGSGYFATGLRIGRILSLQYIWDHERRRQKLCALEAFAEAFREINRRVCVETYAAYHLSALHGEKAGVDAYVPTEFLEHLNRCHHARRNEVTLSSAERRRLFAAFFLWEQDYVVGPGVNAAVAAMDWPLAKWIALRPTIGFRYFKRSELLRFADFADKEERIEKGLRAFDIADKAGWPHVGRSLARYAIMPDAFLADPQRYFDRLKAHIL